MNNKPTLLRHLLGAALLCSAMLSTTAQTNPCLQPPSCIVNGELTAAGPGDMNSSGPTTVNGWRVSHGTPSIDGAVVGMWSYSGMGEGIYTCYNFQAGRSYRVCLRARNTNADSVNNTGNLFIRATNGLTNYGPTGSGLPAPTPVQTISSAYAYSSTWTQLSYTFTPTVNFTQLWIYPHRAGPSIAGGQYQLEVDKVSVIAIPPPATITVKCGDPINLKTPVPNCTGMTYNWYSPTMAFIGSGDVTLLGATPAMAGMYTLEIISGGCSVTTTVNVVVTGCEPCDNFTANFNVLQGCNPVYFAETSTGPGTSVAWFWEFGDGATSNLQNPYHAYAAAGIYNVCLTVVRKAGNETCCKRICKTIKVCPPVSPASAMIDLENEQEPQAGKGEVIVVPNPASTEVKVLLRAITGNHVVLRNMLGAEVATPRKAENEQYFFDISNLPAGIYLVHVEGKEGVFTRKLVKK